MVSVPRNTKHSKWAWMALLFLGWTGKGRLLKMRISCNAEMIEWSKEALDEVKCCFTIDFPDISIHVTGHVCDQALTA